MHNIERYIRSFISEAGYLPLDHFLSLVSTCYYSEQDSLGQHGDFITAPEISQLFGETVGMYAANYWLNSLQKKFVIVEFGPGHGYLMLDFMRATEHIKGFHQSIEKIVLYENSPKLRAKQAVTLEQYGALCHWVDNLDALQQICLKSHTFFIANEFFDALPMKQYESMGQSVYERGVVLGKDGDLRIEPCLPAPFISNPFNCSWILEYSPVTMKYGKFIANCLRNSGSLAIIIDYGYSELQGVSTLQAVRHHKKVGIFEHIGESDITHLVDFSALYELFLASSCRVHFMTQKEFLESWGIDIRISMLLTNPKANKELILSGYDMLTSEDKMGTLFKVLLVSSSGTTYP